MNNKEYRRIAYTPSGLRVREGRDGETPSRTITGYVILFDQSSEPLWEDEETTAREIIDAGAVTQELLDGSDIKMTMFHNRQLILARSNKGSGTLSYGIDERGVYFSFDAPATVDGDKALELVRRGDIAGCSFAFTTRYWDDTCVSKESRAVDGRVETIYRVKVITGIYDFTLAADPAYSGTSCEAEQRELIESLKIPARHVAADSTAAMAQVNDMRRELNTKIV